MTRDWVPPRMRKRFEFSLQTIAASEVAGGIDLVLALQRPLDEELPLPDGATLAASLEEPLAIVEGELR